MFRECRFGRAAEPAEYGLGEGVVNYNLFARAGRTFRARRIIRRVNLIGAAASIVWAAIASNAFATFHYAAPDGVPTATGTVDDPWDLQTALTRPQSVVAPGDTIWIRGGTYVGTFLCNLVGSPDEPIIVRQYPGERATIDGADSDRYGGALFVQARHTWFWGFEITSSDPVRYTDLEGNTTANIPRPVGVYTGPGPGNGLGCRFINLVIHDTAEGYWLGSPADDAEVYGSVVYMNGWLKPSGAGGHGIYPRCYSGVKRIRDNLVFCQFGYGIHAWSDRGVVNLEISGNISFNNGRLGNCYLSNIFVSSGASNLALVENDVYNSGEADIPVGGTGDAGIHIGSADGLIFANNYVVGNRRTNSLDRLAVRFESEPAGAVDIESNVIIDECVGAQLQTLGPGNIYLSAPVGTQVFVRPNAYEDGSGYEAPRANVAIYNWQLAPTVAIDLSEVLVPGDPYEIRDVMNYFGPPLKSGVYTGAPISLDMSMTTVTAPVGVGEDGMPIPPPPHTAPEFAALVVTSPAIDLDEDGIPELADVCPEHVAPGGVDGEGRPFGDLTADCSVSSEDFALFTQCRGGSGMPPATSCPPGIHADFDNDGDVDMADFAVLARNFGELTAPACPDAVAPAGFNSFGRPLGDMNRDCKVGADDFVLFARCFGGAGASIPADCVDPASADLDGDADVDLSDFLIFARNYSG